MKLNKSYFYRLVFWFIEFIIFIAFFSIIIILIYRKFEYKPVGIVVDNVWQPLFILIAGVGIWLILKYFYRDRNFSGIFTNPWYYLVGILIIYNAMVIPVVLRKFYSFGFSQAHDFAIRLHALHNTLEGNILRTDISHFYQPFKNWNFLGDHFSPFILFFLPFYYFRQNGDTLLVIQSIILSIGAIPLYLIVKERLKDRWLGLLVSVLYLLYPVTIKLYLYELRIEYFAVPILLYAFWALQRDRIGLTMLFLLLAGLCKEEAFLAVAGIGVYIFLCKKKVKYNRLIGGLVTIAGISITIFIIKVFIPVFLGYKFYGYGPLGGEEVISKILAYPGVLWKYINWEKIDYFINFFKFLGFVPLLSPIVLLAIPFFLQNLFTDTVATTIHLWHSTFILPFLFISLIYGIGNILKFLPKAKVPLCIWLVSFGFFYGYPEFSNIIVKPFLEYKLYLEVKPNIYKEFCVASRFLPKDKSVYTHFALLPNLSNREKIHNELIYRTADKVEADYIFYSPTIIEKRNTAEKFLVREVVASGRYEMIYSSTNFRVMVRKDIVD